MTDSPFSFGTKVLGSGALFLFTLLGLGVLLPATWAAEAEALLPASPHAVFRYLDSPEGWLAWTPWPDSSTISGPESGSGSMLSWDDDEFGSGSFSIVKTDAPTQVSYKVEVNDGRMWTDGALELSAEGTGTRVHWHEDGDLGRNPLMGFWALSMDRAQSQELQKSLDRLSVLLADSTTATDVDPARTTATDSTDSGPS
jgi:uncharacterized protein YndB with AHSA1/START domain